MRADRLGIAEPQLLVVAETSLERVLDHATQIGPRLIEHVVDTALYFEGDRGYAFRILRAVRSAWPARHGQAETRVREGAKLGFTCCVLPEASLRQLPPIDGVELCAVRSLGDARDVLF